VFLCDQFGAVREFSSGRFGAWDVFKTPALRPLGLALETWTCDKGSACYLPPREVWLTHGKLPTPNIDKLYGIVYFVKG
jgi:hypothetical protein